MRESSKELIKKPIEELTLYDIKRLLQDKALNLWEYYPQLYQTDIDGNFILKKDGTPQRRRGTLDHLKPVKPSLDPEAAARKRIKDKKNEIAKLKASLNRKEKTLAQSKEALEATQGSKGSKVLTEEQFNTNLPEALADKEKKDIVFKANEGPQEDFLASSEDEVLYGGAAGGGKSYAMLADPLRFMSNKNAKALLVRRTLNELRELIDKSRELYPKAFPGAKYRTTDKEWTFPSGAKLIFGYCEKDADVYQYQGQAFTWIGFDELTQWPSDFCWNYMRSRLRDASGTNIPCYMRATANPGGVGGHWVKKRFIDPAPPYETFSEKLQTSQGIQTVTRKFIPARLQDNPFLNTGAYEATLMTLPPTLRKQLLEGNWDVVEGAAFPEFDEAIHVIPPFEVPAHWERYKGIDYGFASPSACEWAAIDPEDGTMIIYRELYQKGLTGSELGTIMREMELPDIKAIPGVLDTAAWNQAGGGYKGPTVGEVLVTMGHKLRRADKNRKAGKVQMHERLRKSHTGRPRLQIFSTCTEIIREMQGLPSDPRDPEDVDTHASDHAYDALRYLIMSRPRIEGDMERLSRYRSEEYTPVDNVFGY